jgi:hypothetical protein
MQSVAVVPLDALEEHLRKHAAPPKSLGESARASFLTAAGPLSFVFKSVSGMLGLPGDGPSIFVAMHWGDGGRSKPRAAPAFAFQVAGIKQGSSDEVVLYRTRRCCVGCAVEYDNYKIAWSNLRHVVVDNGFSLEASLIILPYAVPLGLGDGDSGADVVSGGTRLHVPGGDKEASMFPARFGTLLDGPFTDASVRAGGREWRVHRIVLAAASAAFHSMLESEMVEGRAAAVELIDTDPTAVELFLRHIYGGAVDVPLGAALQVCKLADQYQLSTGLSRSLRLWLMALPLSPAALCELMPAALSVLPGVCEASWLERAADALEELAACPGFKAWPVDAVAAVVALSNPLAGFEAASGWMAAQQQEAAAAVTGVPRAAAGVAATATATEAAAARRWRKQHWRRLLGAVSWSRASCADLRTILSSPGALRAPGLERKLLDASLDRLAVAEARKK